MPDPADALLEFPCRFPIKAMGKAGEGFDALVVELVRRHAPDLEESQVKVRASSGGRWVSVTVVVEATSKTQLDAIYRELTANDRVVWAL
jgi:putative lipoic acid-binding regulatory protein